MFTLVQNDYPGNQMNEWSRDLLETLSNSFSPSQIFPALPRNSTVQYRSGEQNPKARSPETLEFARWRLIFVGSQHRTGLSYQSGTQILRRPLIFCKWYIQYLVQRASPPVLILGRKTPIKDFPLYRVIQKSLRDFGTRLRNNQDRHGRKEHINR